MSRFYSNASKTLQGVNFQWMNDIEEIKTATKRTQAATKSIQSCGYTPHVAKFLAGILVHLSLDNKQRQTEVMNLFSRILDGRNK
uniref:Uncharacterized protein n=1 Tax=viral metagenome TaxID=1070528 RepID=A0A6M3LGA7_9ZZZZ